MPSRGPQRGAGDSLGPRRYPGGHGKTSRGPAADPRDPHDPAGSTWDPLQKAMRIRSALQWGPQVPSRGPRGGAGKTLGPQRGLRGALEDLERSRSGSPDPLQSRLSPGTWRPLRSVIAQSKWLPGPCETFGPQILPPYAVQNCVYTMSKRTPSNCEHRSLKPLDNLQMWQLEKAGGEGACG